MTMRSLVLYLALGCASAFTPALPRHAPRATRSLRLRDSADASEVEAVVPEAASMSDLEAAAAVAPKASVAEEAPAPALSNYEATLAARAEKAAAAAPAAAAAAPAATSALVTAGPPGAGRFAGEKMSTFLPMLVERAPLLDGTHAGDAGFDPLGFSKTNEDLFVFQEAEVKHARLAMLAVAGWLAAEAFPFAPDFLADGDRAPSVLNGGLIDFGGAGRPLVTTLLFFGAFGALECDHVASLKLGTRLGKIHHEDMGGDGNKDWKFGVAGDYNFDPLGLYSTWGDDAVGRKVMRELELSHGRVAMIAISLFAGIEASTGAPALEAAPGLIGVAALAAGGAYAAQNIEEVTEKAKKMAGELGSL